ncbi:MAG: hypothetical protein NT010_07145 [Proteobacteria bacterium]|nr:hypothetical protein [Pseudomonadota bacterium]
MTDFYALIKCQHEHVSTKPEFIYARCNAEQEARNMLDNRVGRFTQDDFISFFQYCNTERVPLNNKTTELKGHATYRRFNPAFMGNNRKLLLSSIEELNLRTERLWKSNGALPEALSRFWSHPQVKGAGIGFPSMIVYLKDQEKYNVWLPSLAKALGYFKDGDKFSTTSRNIENYLKFNNAINDDLRRPFGLKPQEVDYLLYFIGKSFSDDNGIVSG